MHHKTAWAVGGPTILANAAAVCPGCHLGAITVEWPEIVPRAWQLEALEVILPSLRSGGMATLNAAPGAGKTLFTAFVIGNLLASQTIGRAVIVVPNGNLRKQWELALASAGIYIDPSAQDGAENPDSYTGSVVTYQKLYRENVVQTLAQRAANVETLYVFDEVHHVADQGAWGVAVERLVGTFEEPRHPTLNLTGTLFRSKGRIQTTPDGRRIILSEDDQRIATIEYRPDPGDSRKLIAQADYTIDSATLIADEHLRHVSLYEFDFDQGLHIIDLASETVTSGGIIDLKEQPSRTRYDALKTILRDERYLRPTLRAMLVKLAEQERLLQGHPVKGLVVCETQGQAKIIHGLLGSMVPSHMARPMLAISDDEAARDAITSFRQSKRPAILVNVRMVTEGFDCPDVTTIAHLTPWSARLFINQMVARAMRVTDTERELGIIPAALLIPQDERIRRAYAEVLIGTMHVLDLPPVCPTCGQNPCICRYACPRCGESPCVCGLAPPTVCETCGEAPCACEAETGTCPICEQDPCVCGPWDPPDERPSTVFEITADAEEVGYAHDGEDVTVTLERLRPEFESFGLPGIYHPTVAHWAQTHEWRPGGEQRRVFVVDQDGTAQRQATPREIADALNAYMHRAGKWMHGHGQSAAEFHAECNRAAGIPLKNGRQGASIEQLRIAKAKSDELVRRFCAGSFTPLPTWLGD